MIWLIVSIICLLYAFVDVNYFIRTLLTYYIAKYIRKPVKSALESTNVYGICLPSDADFMLTHMNNARYLREFDFGRFDLLTRTGTLDEIMKRGGSFPVSALNIRYRLPLMMFSLYKVVTTPLWWDEKFLYLDQRIVTLSDGIVRSVAITKLAILKNNYEELISRLFPGTQKPEMSPELKTWMTALDLSSEAMKADSKRN